MAGVDDLPRVAKRLLELGKDYPVWLFEGEMGAGKTTLIRAICEELGVEDNVSSPTFSLVNEYLSASGETLYHFDFYRLEDEEEALEIGIEEYFYSGNRCFVEWPSMIPSLLPDDALNIEIEVVDGGERTITLSVYGE